jgi:hypothetical protein
VNVPGVRSRLIGIEQRDAWCDALAGIPHSYWHTWEACAALAKGTGLPTYLFACEDGTTGARVACAFSEREWQGNVDVFTPAGFGGFASVGDPASFRSHWLAMAAERGYVCGYFALHPMLADPSLHAGLADTNTLYVLDLAAHPNLQYDRSVRRDLRDWQQSGRSFVTDRDRLVEFALENYASFMRSMNTNPASIWSSETLQAMCLDPHLLMAGVADEQGICALYAFATSAYGAEAHLNISLRGGREFTTALIGWGIEELAARRVPWLHFGGGVVRGDSVARAKEKFRPAQRPLTVGREIYREDRYRTLCESAGTDAAETGYFPAYRKRSTTDNTV